MPSPEPNKNPPDAATSSAHSASSSASSSSYTTAGPPYTATPAERQRFLDANDGDEVLAKKQLEAYLQWRAETLPLPETAPRLGRELPDLLGVIHCDERLARSASLTSGATDRHGEGVGHGPTDRQGQGAALLFMPAMYASEKGTAKE